MSIATQFPITEAFATQQLTIKPSRLRLMAMLGRLARLSSGVLFGAISLSASASSLVSSTDYLDYELPKELQEHCIERGNCPEIEVKYLKTNHDWINQITNARINNLVVNSKPSESAPVNINTSTRVSVGANIENAKIVKVAIDDFVASQFSDLPEDSVFVYNLMVTPDYLGHVDNFELFEVNSYVFLGGAHGMPYSEYLIFDPSTKQQARLEDMLQRGKKSDFEALVYDAYKTWVKTVDEDVSSYEKNWPFTLSDNVTLTDKGIDIRYQHYSIGPYAYGMPVLSVPYDKLRGIIKPHFVPK